MQLVRARGSTSDWTVWYMIAVTYMKWNSIGIVWGNTNRMGCICYIINVTMSWWRHQMETFSALLALCAGNSPVTGKFTAQRLVARSFDVFIDLPLNKRLCKQSWGWWFETLSHPLWRHRNGCHDNKTAADFSKWMKVDAYISMI